MMQINLLPWREQARRVRKIRFVTALAVSAFAPLIFVLVIHMYLGRMANEQQDVNDVLQAAISQEQSILNEMSSKEEETQSIDIQLKFIINLYNESYHAVRVLKELVSLVPSDIFIAQIKRNGDTVTLSGMANSENDVTQLMHSISESPYFDQPALISIALAKASNSVNSRRFIIKFDQKG